MGQGESFHSLRRLYLKIRRRSSGKLADLVPRCCSQYQVLDFKDVFESNTMYRQIEDLSDQPVTWSLCYAQLAQVFTTHYSIPWPGTGKLELFGSDEGDWHVRHWGFLYPTNCDDRMGMVRLIQRFLYKRNVSPRRMWMPWD